MLSVTDLNCEKRQSFHGHHTFPTLEGNGILRTEKDAPTQLYNQVSSLCCAHPLPLRWMQHGASLKNHHCENIKLMYKYYVSGQYPSPCLYLFILQNTFLRLDSVSVLRNSLLSQAKLLELIPISGDKNQPYQFGPINLSNYPLIFSPPYGIFLSSSRLQFEFFFYCTSHTTACKAISVTFRCS